MISTTPRTSWREGLVAAAAAFAVFRVLTELVGLAAAYRGSAPGQALSDPSVTYRVWSQWDFNWFSDIAAKGYRALGHVVTGGRAHDGAAFPPAMPLLLRAGGAVGLPAGATGVLVSAVFLLLALAALYILVRDDHDASVARWTLVLLLAYPFAFFLGTGYAESLVLLCAVGAFLAARRRAWWVAGILVGVALLAKIVFILLVIPISLEAIEWGGGIPSSIRRRHLPRLLATWVPVITALGAWMIYQQVVLGDPLRFLKAQRGWERALGLPLAQVAYIFDPARKLGVRFINSVDTLALLVLAVMTVCVYRRVRPTYGVLLALLLAVFTFNTSLASNGRHLAVLFPIFLGLAIMTERRTWLRPLIVVAQLPLALLLLSRFVTGHWAG
ncbi:MAG: hypothetical protein ABR573_01285 [Candidatus Dormibacteria bacterium]